MVRTIRNREKERARRRLDTEVADDRPVLEPYRPRSEFERWAPGWLICVAVVIAYIPSYNNQFVSWDDDHYLYKNQQVILPSGLPSALFDVKEYRDTDVRGTRPREEGNRVSHQYYPLVFGVYWLEFRLYSLLFDEPTIPNPQAAWNGQRFDMMSPRVARGFHITSVVFHCMNVFLLIHLMRLLGVNTWVATAATALFALTPINVATVAWAAERKNIFALMFYMLAMMSYLRFRRRGGWLGYVGCLVLYQCALFSKTVAVTFPVMIILTDRLIDRRWTMMSIVRAVPLFVQAGLAAGITISVEDRARTIPIKYAYQRPFIAAAALWFYTIKACVPVDLLPVYRLWTLPIFSGQSAVRDLLWLLPLVGTLVAAMVLWLGRRRIPGVAYWAIGLFVVTQAPMLGFKNINYFQFAFVADHYFYNGGIGLFLVVALGLEWLARRGWRHSPRVAMTGVAAVAAAAFAALTFDRCKDWYDAESFWYTTITGDRDHRYEDWGDDRGAIWKTRGGNPFCYPAYYNLANQAGRDADAARRSGDVQAYAAEVDKANQLFRMAMRAYRETHPERAELWQACEMVLRIEQVRKNYDEVVRLGGRFVRKYPDHGPAHLYVAQALVRLERLDEARTHFVAALNARRPPLLAREDKVKAWLGLGSVYLNQEDHDSAIKCADNALALDPGNKYALELKRAAEAAKRSGESP